MVVTGYRQGGNAVLVGEGCKAKRERRPVMSQGDNHTKGCVSRCDCGQTGRQEGAPDLIGRGGCGILGVGGGFQLGLKTAKVMSDERSVCEDDMSKSAVTHRAQSPRAVASVKATSHKDLHVLHADKRAVILAGMFTSGFGDSCIESLGLEGILDVSEWGMRGN